MNETFYRRMFLAACVWNIAGGVLLRIFTRPFFVRAWMTRPAPTAYYDAWIAMVFVFGLAYFLVSRNLFRNTDLVIVAAIAKALFGAIFSYHLLARRPWLPAIVWVAVAGDLVFVLLFLNFLAFARRRSGCL